MPAATVIVEAAVPPLVPEAFVPLRVKSISTSVLVAVRVRLPDSSVHVIVSAGPRFTPWTIRLQLAGPGSTTIFRVAGDQDVRGSVTTNSGPRGNPSPKLAITVDPDIHQHILTAAASEGLSVSAWLTTAAREALQRRAGLAAIAEWEQQHGAFSQQEMDQARRTVSRQLRKPRAVRRTP